MENTPAVLVADDPRRQSEKLLRHMVRKYKATTAAAVAVTDGEPTTFAGEVPLSRLAALQLVWTVEEKVLRAGRPVIGDGYTVLPLTDARQLIGLLFIEGGEGVEPKAACVLALATALKVWREEAALRPAVGEAATDITATGIERQRLLSALERNEWNIARVARLFGVTRRTIYLRLARYKIQRRRVPKTLKAFPLAEQA